MAIRKASIKETGEEISQAEWERFDAAVARAKAERAEPSQVEPDLFEIVLAADCVEARR